MGGILPSVGSVTNQGREALRNFVDVAKLHRPGDRAGGISREERRPLDGGLLPPLNGVDEIFSLNILDTFAFELLGPLEWRPLFVLVRVIAGADPGRPTESSVAGTILPDAAVGSGAFGADSADGSSPEPRRPGCAKSAPSTPTDKTDVIAAPSTNNLLNIQASLYLGRPSICPPGPPARPAVALFVHLHVAADELRLFDDVALHRAFEIRLVRDLRASQLGVERVELEEVAVLAVRRTGADVSRCPMPLMPPLPAPSANPLLSAEDPRPASDRRRRTASGSSARPDRRRSARDSASWPGSS